MAGRGLERVWTGEVAAAAAVAAAAVANFTLALLMAPDGDYQVFKTLAPPGPLSACDGDAILFWHLLLVTLALRI